jgi:hypothetical protein
MLASTCKSLNSMLKDITTEYKRREYERLRGLDTATHFFSILQPHFNTLHITTKRSVRTRFRQKRIIAREFSFGFYTGRMDEWHQATLSVPPFWTNAGARLRVVSCNDSLSTKRTFRGIFCVGQMIRILETRWWHSSYCVFRNGWSYVHNEPSPVLVLGCEE